MVLASFVGFECYNVPACCCDSKGEGGDDRAVESQAYASVGEFSVGEDFECFHDSFVLGLYNTNVVAVTGSAASSVLRTPRGDHIARKCVVGEDCRRGPDRPDARGSAGEQAEVVHDELDEGRKTVEVSAPPLLRTPLRDERCAGTQLGELSSIHREEGSSLGSPGVAHAADASSLTCSLSVAAETVQRPFMPSTTPVSRQRPGDVGAGGGEVAEAPGTGSQANTASLASPPLLDSRGLDEEEVVDLSELCDSPSGYLDRFTGFHEVGSLDDDEFSV